MAYHVMRQGKHTLQKNITGKYYKMSCLYVWEAVVLR